MTIVLNGTTGITSPGGDTSTSLTTTTLTATTVNTQNTFGFKNRIINGAMMIDQRNAGAEVNPAVNSTYYVDRWYAVSGAAGKFKIGQNAGAVTPPVGFVNYLGCTSLSSYSLGASEFFGVRQAVEGLNVADFGWGTANAQPITISFWVRSSLTGTFGFHVINTNGTRAYPASYTISAANTWEQKTVTISGDTSGTWLTTNGIGLILTFGLGYGSSISGTANVWNSGTAYMPTGATSVVGTSGATFYITGVQLEKGSTATSFDYRPYGTELALCQRYCLVYSNATDGNFRFFGFNYSTGVGLAQCYFPVQTRVAPTGITTSTASAFTFYQNGTAVALSAIGYDNASNKTGNVTVTATGLTANGGCILGGQTSGNKIEFTGMEL